MPRAEFKQRIVGAAEWLARLPGARHLVRAMSRSRVPVFLLHRATQREHGIYGTDPARLGGFLDALSEQGCRFLSLREVLRYMREDEPVPQHSVAFTADDGYWDQAELIAPVFCERQVPLTIFLITGFLDGRLWPWDARIAHAFQASGTDTISVNLGRLNLEFPLRTDTRRRFSRKECQAIAKTLDPARLEAFIESIYGGAGLDQEPRPPRHFRPMTWDLARELESRGVEFGPHTESHRILTRQDDKGVRHELSSSWARVTDELKNPLRVIAWPVGHRRDFGERERQIAAELGFDGAIAANDHYSRSDIPAAAFAMDRFGFPEAEDVRTALQIVSGLRSLGEFGGSHASEQVNFQDYYQAADGSPGWGLRVQMGMTLSRVGIALGKYRRPDPEALGNVRRIVFICQGNICRSPYAEALARTMGIEAVSCGLRANEISSADPVAARVAFLRGLDLSKHRSRALQNVEITDTDLVLAMEPAHLGELEAVAARSGARVSLLGLWAKPPVPWIADPFGAAPEIYDASFAWIDQAMERLALDLRGASAGHGRGG